MDAVELGRPVDLAATIADCVKPVIGRRHWELHMPVGIGHRVEVALLGVRGLHLIKRIAVLGSHLLH